MKQIFFLVLLLVMSCKTDKKIDAPVVESVTNSKEKTYASFGDKITDENVLSANEMMNAYKTLSAGDTLNLKTTGKIVDLCSKKGCWMKLDMGNDEIVRVTFKDYGFFMPLNAKGDVVVNGKAYVTETSIADLKHYAEDAGKPQTEIDAITAPERTYAFVADGVLLAE